ADGLSRAAPRSRRRPRRLPARVPSALGRGRWRSRQRQAQGSEEAQPGRRGLKAGTLVGKRYRLQRLLGGGGMALVYGARDERLDRPVAVKVLAENLAEQPEIRERFLREAQLAAQLSHPNVVAVYDAGEQDGRPYIVMEYADGETLAQELQRR